MIFFALNKYYERLLDNPDSGISPPGFSMEKVSYAIVLDYRGCVVSVDDIRDTSGKKPVPKVLIVPQPPKRASNIAPCFLWDKTSYALGVSNNSKRSSQEHIAFKDLHFSALQGSTDEGLQAFLLFLANWTPNQVEKNPYFLRHGDDFIDTNIVFRLDGEKRYLHERQAVDEARASLTATGMQTGVCLVTGNLAPIARLHPAIKGVKGAQSSGASIVSFNLSAFSSYGKNQGENAPISEQVAFAYTTVLNYLLRRDGTNRQRIQIGDSTVVFWAQAGTREEAEKAENIFAALMDPEDDDAREISLVHDFLDLVRQGKPGPMSSLDEKLIKGTRVFILGLAPNASRLSIRFWEAETLEVFAQRLAQHYSDLRIEPSPWKKPPAIWRLLLATAPSRNGKTKSEDVSPVLAGELARAILTGQNYPYSLLGNTIMRFRADADISGTRVALIKGVLTRFRRLTKNGNKGGKLPVSLDETNTDPGYLLGRLFYLLENAQNQAISGINAGIKDKYYGSASATPALVYPTLMRNFQNHLSKLRKGGERGKAIAGAVERDAARIINLLGSAFPKSLKLEAQGHFAIGYYHQSQARFLSKESQEVVISDEGDEL